VHAAHIQASLAGSVSTTKSQSSNVGDSLSITASFLHSSLVPSRSITRANTLPRVQSVILARITRLQPRQANVAILVVDDNVCADAFQGVVRREDVRGWEVDKVVLGDCFRVGDVIRAVVISLGDQSSYFLSTARNELGVLLATSEGGNQMVPISWKEFRDLETGKKEGRKVAKPV